MSTRFMITASMLAISSTAAHAQTSTQAASDPSTSPAAPSASEATQAAPIPNADVADIVVTALRSRQNLQKTPAAVTVVTADTLKQQQITDIRGIQSLVPAARFSAANTSTRIYIRGVGSALDYYWIPETTAVNFNGVYLPRYATTGGFFDLENVQVLPGPQGVLYGRSAGGGAVAINSARPVDKLEASGNFEYGNYHYYRVEGMLNVPVKDNLWLRGAAYLSKHDGYQDYGLQGDDSYSVRLSALWKPTDRLSVYLWGTHYQQKGKPTAAQYLPFIAGHNPWYVPANDPVTGADNSRGAFEDFIYTVVGGEVKYDLGFADLSYTGSYLRQTEVALRKLVGNDQPVNNAQNQYTQNIHVSGETGRLSWIGGVDWFNAKSRYDVRFGPHQFGQIFDPIKQRSISGFGQLTYKMADDLRLVGGARYTRDKLLIEGDDIACFGACFLSPVHFDKAWRHIDAKGGLEYDVASRVMVYANIQTGYAPGTLNTYSDYVTLNKEIEPQTVLAETAGVKSTFDNGLLTLNLEGFHYAYKKLIIQAYLASLSQQSLFNAPHATVYGLQLTAGLHPSPRDTLSANVAYTHGRYGHFVALTGAIDLDGLQMVYTPTWTTTLSYDHRFDLANGASVDAVVNSYISSSYWGTFDHTDGVRQSPYTKTDLSVTYYAAGKRWSVGGWIKNIENSAVNTGFVSSGYGGIYAGATFLEPPRTYGLTLGFKI